MDFVKRRPIIWLGSLAVVVAVCYVGMMLMETNGRFIAPLDDAYIHFQYARQMALGEPWRYNSGELPTSGGTSLLYPVILTLFYWVGFQGERLVIAALLLGIVALAASAVLVYKLTRLLIGDEGERTALITASLFLLTGGVQWGYLNGMESGLFSWLVLATLVAFVEKRWGRTAVYMGIATLIRPEGMFLAGVLWLVVVGQLVLQDERIKLFISASPRLSAMFKNSPAETQGRREEKEGTITQLTGDAWRRLLLVTGAVLVSLLPLLLNWLITGSVASAGAQAKSWLGNVPFRLGDILGSIAGAYGDILARLALGFLVPKAWFILPGMLLVAFGGWWLLWRRGRGDFVLLTVGWVFLGCLSTATLITSIWQYGRYQLPFLTILFPIAAVAGHALLHERLTKPNGLLLGALAGLFGLVGYTSGDAWLHYQESVQTVNGQALLLADWINENLPADAHVGVHDAGAIRYVGQRPIYDMIGLTEPGDVAVAWKHGMGAVFELMEQLPQKPTFFATYPDVFSIPYLVDTSVLDVELFRAEVVDYSPITAASGTQLVYEADWTLAQSGGQLYQQNMLQKTADLALLQQIDVADLTSEAENNFSWWEGVVLPGFATDLQQLSYRTDPSREVLDGGRLVTGGMTWQTAVSPQQPLLLTARLHAQVAGLVDVVVDGEVVGAWRYPALPGEWLETAFVVPATAVHGTAVHGTGVQNEQVTIELRVPAETAHHFALYHLWVWQGEPAGLDVAAETVVEAQFGEDIQLLGYTITVQDGINVMLHWQGEGVTNVDAKVFVHLYDEAGNLVTQADGYPNYGTQPPYTWLAGEVVLDERQLVGVENGRYQLVVGLYEPETGIRLPLQAPSESTLSDNRLLLQTLVINGN